MSSLNGAISSVNGMEKNTVPDKKKRVMSAAIYSKRSDKHNLIKKTRSSVSGHDNEGSAGTLRYIKPNAL